MRIPLLFPAYSGKSPFLLKPDYLLNYSTKICSIFSFLSASFPLRGNPRRCEKKRGRHNQAGNFLSPLRAPAHKERVWFCPDPHEEKPKKLRDTPKLSLTAIPYAPALSAAPPLRIWDWKPPAFPLPPAKTLPHRPWSPDRAK